MGKVIPTLTNTTYITKILPQNCPKTTSKLPQNFWICSDLPSVPPFGGFEAQKECLKTFGFGWKKTHLSHLFFYFDVFTYLTYSPAHFLTPFPHQANGLFARQQAVEAAGESDLASKLSRDYQEKQVYLLTPLLFCVFTLRNCIFCD